MKPQTTLLTIAITLLSAICINTQAQKDSAKAFLLSHNDQLVIGVYAGQNFTFPKSTFNAYEGSRSSPGRGISMEGATYEMSLKYKLPQKFFLSTGITYQKENFALTQYGGYDYPMFSAIPPPLNGYNNDYYIYSYSANYIGVPLSLGYFYTNKRLTYYASLGVEFYYNPQFTINLYDDTKGITLSNNTIDNHNIPLDIWTYGPFFDPDFWAPFGAFGLLSFGQSYLVTPKISISYEANLRFGSPLNQSFYTDTPEASFSLNLGLSYTFDIDNTGSFLLPDKANVPKKHMAGFKLIPNFFVFTQPPLQGYLSLSYAFSMQFNLTNRLALETGVVIDNFSNNGIAAYVSFGVPLIAKYYFPKENGPSYFIGVGVHMDWPNNFDYGWEWELGWGKYSTQWIRPIGVIENGWDYKLGNNYILNVAFGLENWLKPILLSNINLYGYNSPIVLFGSIGMSYSF